MICIVVNVNAYNEIQQKKKKLPNKTTTAEAAEATTKKQTRLYMIILCIRMQKES